jgi:putative zinc finger/helix-turn-helix YgiT family protein
MKVKIECPYCDGMAVLMKQPRELTYRKEVFKIIEHFYKCEKCNEEFTTTESDTISLVQAHNQYREKHKILFPEDIIVLREKYGLSATKMSEVLGLGVNGYSNYEKGEMPNPAMGNLIKTADKPEVFMELLENAKQYFSENSFEKVKNKVIGDDKKNRPFYTPLNISGTPTNYTGYKKISTSKVAGLVTYFITKSNADFNSKLKLNKQLFYVDFKHYKNYGRSITGLTYRAINYGPVPSNYDSIYVWLENEQIISSYWTKVNSGAAIESFTTSAVVESFIFSEEEQETIDSIIHQFKNMSAWDIVELSHRERAWKESEEGRKLISYQEYAFDLIGA